jgi:hypothetical protein
MKYKKAREDLLAKRREIDEHLQSLDRRWEAAEAYEAVLRGKPISHPPRRERQARPEASAEREEPSYWTSYGSNPMASLPIRSTSL